MTAQDTEEHPSLKRAVGGVLPGLAWSVTTAPMAQLPLVLIPGPGSVLYRGLGTVLVGGMAVNSVFTLVLLPTLLRLIEKPAPHEAAAPLKPMEAHV